MTEHQIETIEKMFPRGFVLVAVDVRATIVVRHNPQKSQGVNVLYDANMALVTAIQREFYEGGAIDAGQDDTDEDDEEDLLGGPDAQTT